MKANAKVSAHIHPFKKVQNIVPFITFVPFVLIQKVIKQNISGTKSRKQRRQRSISVRKMAYIHCCEKKPLSETVKVNINEETNHVYQLIILILILFFNLEK